jgi:hypothetical protein
MYRISNFLACGLSGGVIFLVKRQKPRSFIKEIYLIKRDQIKKINILIKFVLVFFTYQKRSKK